MNKIEQAVSDITKLIDTICEWAEETKVWDVKEKTCPKCCPDGDDPDWGAFGNEKGVVCGYADCKEPLTVITLDDVKRELSTLISKQAEEIERDMEGFKRILTYAINMQLGTAETTSDEFIAYIFKEASKRYDYHYAQQALKE